MTQQEDRVRHLFGVNIEGNVNMADSMPPEIARAAQRLVSCLLSDNRIFLCGNGGSAANCLHFSAAMLNHLDVERPPLPVIALNTDMTALTAISNEGHYEQVFARQIQALGEENDVLIVLSTTGNSNSILYAVNAAKEKGIDIIALSGRDGGVLVNHLGPEDFELRVPGETAVRIREAHLFILHCFCDLIDQSLFGQMLG